jgi:hypothetical protein
MGYDQTNFDFYQVTRVNGKYVEVRKIAQKITKKNGWTENAVAIKDSFLPDDAPIKRKVLEGNAISPESSRWAVLWDGQELYQSHGA